MFCQLLSPETENRLVLLVTVAVHIHACCVISHTVSACKPGNLAMITIHMIHYRVLLSKQYLHLWYDYVCVTMTAYFVLTVLSLEGLPQPACLARWHKLKQWPEFTTQQLSKQKLGITIYGNKINTLLEDKWTVIVIGSSCHD